VKVLPVSSICRLLCAVAAILVVGCAPSSLEVNLRYLPQTDVQPIRGAESVQLAVTVDDVRSNKADVGTAATPLRTWEITTTENLAETARGAVLIELQDRGFKIGDGSGKVAINLNGLDVERRRGWFWENRAHAFLTMQVRVMKKDGAVIYAHEAAGEDGDSDIADDRSVGAAERVMNLALRNCIQRLFADPKFIEALLKASKP
jgi:hypothetical protein